MIEVVWTHRVVVGDRLDGVFDDFDIPARLEAAQAVAEELVPVGDAAEELADVDKVELVFGVGPGESDVVDFEGAVWGDEGGLDGGEVNAGDAGAGELVGGVSGCIVSTQ